jgi:integrative and conjugative element protein (TIGR02256 family)
MFRVIPGQDPCKTCLSLYRGMAVSQFIDISEDSTLPIITNECNNPVRPGSAADLKIVASLAARVVIDYLQGTSTNANHWIWNTEPLDGLALGQNQTGAMHAQTMLPHPECSVCRKIENTNVRVLKEVYEAIRNCAKESNASETGGILIGTYDGKGFYLIQRATGPGPNSIRTANAFEKDIEYSQIQLAMIAQELGKDALYLGEWHYHPTLSNEPSGTDIKSLTEIAAQENYLIDRPIMLIVSKNLEVGLSVHMKTGRWTRIPLTVVDDRA